MRKLALLSLVLVSSIPAQKNPLDEMIQAARASSPALKDLLLKGMPTIKARGAVAVWGQDFLFAVDAPLASIVSISLQGKPPAPMTRVPDSTIWYRLEKMGGGAVYRFQFFADGKPLSANDNFSYDGAGYLPDSYPQPGVPRGAQSEMKTHISKIYPDMKANYWVYVNPGIDTVRGAPLMVWQDGETHVDAADLIRKRMQIVTDNLVHQKRIPPMVHVLVSPGASKDGRPMRSIQYDTVSSLYGRYLLEEILPEVEQRYKIRADAYSRAIEGISSGAICAWNVAWYYPEQFSRVLSNIGSFAPLQWRPEQGLEGGNIIPTRVRLNPRKNIRIWLSDGTDDNSVWSFQNIMLANSLKMQGYDFHFRFGEGMHSVAQGALDLPEALTWLWRDYDPAVTQKNFEQDPAERDKPMFRVQIANRDAW